MSCRIERTNHKLSHFCGKDTAKTSEAALFYFEGFHLKEHFQGNF